MKVKVKVAGLPGEFVEYNADRIECHVAQIDKYQDTVMVLKYKNFPDISLTTSLYDIIIEG